MTRALVPVVGANSRPLGASHWDTSNGEYGSFYRKKRAREVFRRDVDEPSVTVEEQPLAGEVLMAQPAQQVVVDGAYRQENEVLRRELDDCKAELERLRRAVEEVLGANAAGGVAIPPAVPQAFPQPVPQAVPRAAPVAYPGREDAAVQTPESVAIAAAEAERAAGRAADMAAVKVNPPFRTGVYRPPAVVRDPFRDPSAHTPLWRLPKERSLELERPVKVVPARPYRPGTGNIGAYKNPPYSRNGVGPSWGGQ
ncbi:hypothetical protein KFL_001930090 [Klebsormidium nitens]|uniref:Uncharacterized protein n=1 Tax=Klebsormidium nitens TaxID=105231 RepID=A0A1Y1I5V0_KLENI|nr:hypothetical protein KFL_001930090 [Klebsormidium nitens]|eukprot:GAQ84531.1 hypothetical protein KFL_001930090 [Klebsormidium nitens]